MYKKINNADQSNFFIKFIGKLKSMAIIYSVASISLTLFGINNPICFLNIYLLVNSANKYYI